ncbi:MAG: GNAT family N-acetyltransferase, partial [Alphaproteobacteria bacterium]|nr:GNAT family N-acetyltransferase [Alphaproteobacteria bacterium]
MANPPNCQRPDRSPFGSDRLLFRPFAPGDAGEAFAIFGDAEVMRYSISGQDRDRAATAARVERYARQSGQSGFAPWAMVERATGRVIGLCGLMRLKTGEDIELAYRIRRDRWGRGLATEAAAAWLERGFGVLDLPRILAFVEATNTA